MSGNTNPKPSQNSSIPSDWTEIQLGKVFRLSSGKMKPILIKRQHSENFIYPVIGGNGIMGYASEYNSDGEIIIIGRVGENCGISSVINAKCWITDNALFTKEFLINVNTNFLAYKLQYEDLSKLRSKGGQPLISQNPIYIQKISLPPLPEQKAIARVLSTWDEAIRLTQDLIAQKELQKKWLMQVLLTGKKRLEGFENKNWKIFPLEYFIKPVARVIPKPIEPYVGIGLRSHGKGTFLKPNEQPEKNSMDKFYIVRPNDLIVNITFAWEQAIAIVRPDDDGALASHRFPTYTFNDSKGYPEFFKFFIIQPRMKFMLELISPGGAGRNRVMSKSDFNNLEFSFPDFKEQIAIAQVLQSAEKEIDQLKNKAEKLHQQKKGLMQQLLTGKKRLTILN